jgi:phosphoserine phosphatase
MNESEATVSMRDSSNRIIVVDLDGTLVHTDLLVENLFLFLRLFPLRILQVIAWLFKGKAHFKRLLADTVIPEVLSLPYNLELLDWLKQQKNNGAHLVLATGSDVRIAKKVADYLGIFDEVYGNETVNLSSLHKQQFLVDRFGQYGYEYVGNSLADLAVWSTSSLIHIANPERGVLSAVNRLEQMGQIFSKPGSYFSSLFKSLRLHHWTKNLLVFVPLAGQYHQTLTFLVW